MEGFIRRPGHYSILYVSSPWNGPLNLKDLKDLSVSVPLWKSIKWPWGMIWANYGCILCILFLWLHPVQSSRKILQFLLNWKLVVSATSFHKSDERSTLKTPRLSKMKQSIRKQKNLYSILKNQPKNRMEEEGIKLKLCISSLIVAIFAILISIIFQRICLFLMRTQDTRREFNWWLRWL